MYEEYLKTISELSNLMKTEKINLATINDTNFIKTDSNMFITDYKIKELGL